MHFVLLLIVLALGTSPSSPLPSAAVAFYNPHSGGGSQLNRSGTGGEPLNVSQPMNLGHIIPN